MDYQKVYEILFLAFALLAIFNLWMKDYSDSGLMTLLAVTMVYCIVKTKEKKLQTKQPDQR